MDAIGLQGIWLNFPGLGQATPSVRPAQVGAYVRYLISQSQLEESRQAQLRRYRQRIAIRALEFEQAQKHLENQQRTLSMYSVLFSEL